MKLSQLVTENDKIQWWKELPAIWQEILLVNYFIEKKEMKKDWEDQFFFINHRTFVSGYIIMMY
jgi:hypothetical protein